MTTGELFNRLRGMNLFIGLTADEFKRQYMLKLLGLGYTKYDTTKKDMNEISESGLEFIVNELEDIKKILNPDKEEDIVATSSEWKWFSRETL
ncbi:hypothetical protein QUF80_22805 [Desulfococcaceae bacterium HSG8]|nr:hypothetical protein [Desulfococcaceae bacterium HSG8]